MRLTVPETVPKTDPPESSCARYKRKRGLHPVCVAPQSEAARLSRGAQGLRAGLLSPQQRRGGRLVEVQQQLGSRAGPHTLQGRSQVRVLQVPAAGLAVEAGARRCDACTPSRQRCQVDEPRQGLRCLLSVLQDVGFRSTLLAHAC